MNYILIIVIMYIPSSYVEPRDHSQTVIERLSEKSCELLKAEYLKTYQEYLNSRDYSVRANCFKTGE